MGITAITGTFERGAAVALNAPSGQMVGKGVTAYSSGEIARVIGRHSEEVEAILSYRGRPAIVHRDDMVLLR